MTQTQPLTFGSLFAGIGGIDLGLERAGMVCKWQVEIDDYANRVLAKHWPNVPRWRDVRTFPRPGWVTPDVIAGGFPCQDISDAGKRAGIEGDRSGLWSEFARIIRELRPAVVFVENVPALLRRGMGRVVGDLAESGYDCEWQSLPSAAFGSHFVGERIYILAQDTKTSRLRWEGGRAFDETPAGTDQWGSGEFERLVRHEIQHGVPAGSIGRISDGLSSRTHRLRGLGNAVVPQVAEFIGRRIVAQHERSVRRNDASGVGQ